ncbi:cysteine-rich receptor-like protein kinase 19 [Pyrus ussuriensis x Pyrus communis]|uniref:Cysteine-rich receptor-like protein kinase 19 n=1 Tax=Pyrus ussuriensis x Pyrus communis TaxID=2448454 RepID=A0A5N5HIF9_9ROSA|nr:cysteine-rich receptor-like protein kinase 19 [Pyrus ussuriensis x Pyrus communis]
MFVISVCMLSLVSLTSGGDPDIRTFRGCDADTPFDDWESSEFPSNLNDLFSALNSNATSETGYYNATFGKKLTEMAHGCFLCRGDVEVDVCTQCVNAAILTAVRSCPRSKGVVWWYGKTPVLKVNTTRSDEPTGFNQMKVNTCLNSPTSVLNDLVTEASKASSKFATKEAHVTGSNITLYSLAQCTQDLSTADCNSCLRVAVAQVVSTNRGINGGLFLCPSCNVRYETFPFYGKPRVRHLRRRRPPPLPPQARNDIAAIESLQLDLETIETATNKFSDSNKLGQGGFGEVFEGTLGVNGQEIAVKRLSKSSLQGVQELKNEVLLIAMLQHRNLVKLLGFCLEGEETILVYEYVPNKSLDYFPNGI